MAIHKFKVWWPDRGQSSEDARIFTAVDHRHAATIWADWYDAYSADFSIVGGEVAEAKVLREDEVVPLTCVVRGQLSRTYNASEAEPQESTT